MRLACHRPRKIQTRASLASGQCSKQFVAICADWQFAPCSPDRSDELLGQFANQSQPKAPLTALTDTI